ncbi:MAG TPA: hypothetical protein VNZ66_02710 [Aeromicrobium sp.]|nr:hypothetical protein [Aeromicrobium sp.]
MSEPSISVEDNQNSSRAADKHGIVTCTFTVAGAPTRDEEWWTVPDTSWSPLTAVHFESLRPGYDDATLRQWTTDHPDALYDANGQAWVVWLSSGSSTTWPPTSTGVGGELKATVIDRIATEID